jgi:actin-related protein 5
MAPTAIDEPAAAAPPQDTKTYPPAKIYNVKDIRFEKYIEPKSDGRKRALEQPGSAAIVIDNGSSAVRAGWSFESSPRFIIPPIMAKYRDRKIGKTFSFAGSDCYADTTREAIFAMPLRPVPA